MAKTPSSGRAARLGDMWYSIYSNKAALCGLIIIVLLALTAIVVYITELMGINILPYDPNQANMDEAFIAPCAEHWFGTDQLGRDIFSRVIDGTKISLSVGIAAVAISLTLGTILGSIGGYFGGKLDNLIMRFMDVILSVPSILLAIAFMAAMGRGLDKAVLAYRAISDLGKIPKERIYEKIDYKPINHGSLSKEISRIWQGKEQKGRERLNERGKTNTIGIPVC